MKGLLKKIIRSFFQASHLVLHFIQSCDQNDRDMTRSGICLEAFAHLETIDSGHPNIGDNEVGLSVFFHRLQKKAPSLKVTVSNLNEARVRSTNSGSALHHLQRKCVFGLRSFDPPDKIQRP